MPNEDFDADTDDAGCRQSDWQQWEPSILVFGAMAALVWWYAGPVVAIVAFFGALATHLTTQ